MKSKRILLLTLLGGCTAMALAATFLNVGVARAEEPQGVALRQDSARGGGGFFYVYRSHQGGGLRGGK